MGQQVIPERDMVEDLYFAGMDSYFASVENGINPLVDIFDVTDIESIDSSMKWGKLAWPALILAIPAIGLSVKGATTLLARNRMARLRQNLRTLDQDLSTFSWDMKALKNSFRYGQDTVKTRAYDAVQGFYNHRGTVLGQADDYYNAVARSLFGKDFKQGYGYSGLKDNLEVAIKSSHPPYKNTLFLNVCLNPSKEIMTN